MVKRGFRFKPAFIWRSPEFLCNTSQRVSGNQITAISHRNQALTSQAQRLALSMKDTLPSASFTRA